LKLFHLGENNFGDKISSHIIKGLFNIDTELVPFTTQGKLIAIGSVIKHAMQDNDVIWGSGLLQHGQTYIKKGCRVLAVRGKLTKDNLNIKSDVVYGDPAILLPLIYNPKIKKKYKIGLIPHYVDKKYINIDDKKVKIIDIQADWKVVIDDILSCEKVLSSSLHGIIAAETYNIPTSWIVISNEIKGNNFKFHDYFSGTERINIKPIRWSNNFKSFDVLPEPKFNRQGLIDSFTNYFKLESIKIDDEIVIEDKESTIEEVEKEILEEKIQELDNNNNFNIEKEI
jgi:pyruvyltransferase